MMSTEEKCGCCGGSGGRYEPSCGPNGGVYWSPCIRCNGTGSELPLDPDPTFEKGNRPLTAPCLLCDGHGWAGDLFDIHHTPEKKRKPCPRCKGLGQDPDAPEDDDDAEAWSDQVVTLRDEAENAGCLKEFRAWMKKPKARGAVYPECNSFDAKSLPWMKGKRRSR